MAVKEANKGGNRIDESGVIPGLTVEARDERVHVWITPKFKVVRDGHAMQGLALSLEGFEVEKDSALKHNKRPQKFDLKIDLAGFTLELPVEAALEGPVERDGRSGMLFVFTQIGQAERDALRRFIRAHLSGNVVTLDDISRRQDAPTRTRNGSRNGGRNGRVRIREEHPVTRSVRRLVNLTVTLGAIALIAMVGGFAVYERLTLVESTFAAVTAPSVTLLAPADGQLSVNDVHAGDNVLRDHQLVTVNSPDIDASVISSQARARVTGSTIDRAELAANELRQSANTIHSPCACSVLWAPEDGSWVLKGQRLFTLARTGGADLRVEALIHVRNMNRLYRGQRAFVTWPESGDISPGTIEYIALDTQRQPRVGFPSWLRQDQSLMSVVVQMDEPIEPDMVGNPVDVFVRTELPFLDVLRRYLDAAEPTFPEGSVVHEE